METTAAEADGAGHLAAIHRLTAALVAAPTVESIYEASLEVLVESLSADRAAVLLFDDDGLLRFKAWRGLSERYRQAVEGHCPWPRSCEGPSPEPILVADVATDDSIGPLRDLVLAEGIHTLAFVPLLYGNRLLGKFMVYADEPHRIGSAELAVARTVAGHVAFAIEKRRLEDELRLLADKLAATLDAVSESITVQGPGGELLLANQMAARMLGFPSVETLIEAGTAGLAARFELLDEHHRPLPPERLPGRAALRGEEPEEMMVRWRRAGTGEERISLVNATPVLDEAGEVRFAVNIFRDVTERQRAVEALEASEARLAFLASASRRLLTSSLEPSRVLEEVVNLVVPELADWCVVRELARDGLVRTAVGPRHLEAEEPLLSLQRCHDALRNHAVGIELAEGRSLVISPETLRELANDQSLCGTDGDASEHIGRVAEHGVHSLVLVPLRARGRTVGVLTLAAGPGRPDYGRADQTLAQELAVRVGAAMDNARSFASERTTAETLARALLPGRLPDIPGLQLAARYQTAGDVGGDFYDCFPTSEGTWMLVVGDVCGRGIDAASMTGLTRHTIRAAALHGRPPASVLCYLNRLLLDAAGEEMAGWLPRDHFSRPSFCTVCLAEVTPSEGGARVVVSAAGHPLPLVVRHDGEVVEAGRPGDLLGVMPELHVGEDVCDLGPGDALVLFTDGITERRREGTLFEDELRATLRSLAGLPAAELAPRLEHAAVSFGVEAPDDDMAVLVVSVPARPLVAEVPDGMLHRAGLRPA